MSSKPGLTAAVIDQILFAMEDQESHCVFNLATYTVEPLEDENLVAEERVLPLPSWSSSDGFRMMREFTEGLHHPSVQAELHEILDTGQGVFRRFKQVLKPRDVLYRQWLRFKRRFMEDAVFDWVDQYPEEFGPEGRDLVASWDPPSLLATDFTCHSGRSTESDRLLSWDQEACREASGCVFGEEQAFRWTEFFRRDRDWKSGDHYWVAVNPEGEWAGVIWVRPWIPTTPAEGKALDVLLWFVDPVYRGLGLGSLLLQKALEAQTEPLPIFLSAPQGGQRVEGVLTRAGFAARGKLWSFVPG